MARPFQGEINRFLSASPHVSNDSCGTFTSDDSVRECAARRVQLTGPCLSQYASETSGDLSLPRPGPHHGVQFDGSPMVICSDLFLSIPTSRSRHRLRPLVHQDKVKSITAALWAYHRLLVEHSLRRDQIISAVDAVSSSSKERSSCVHVEQLKKEIRLKFSGSPFLNRETLDCVFLSSPSTHIAGGFALQRHGRLACS